VSDQERALSLVRAARRQLESLRVLRGASRGALIAAALGLLLLLLEKAPGGSVLPTSLAWWLTLAGALAGVVATRLRPAIPVAAAALYLDQRCHTEERFVTLWSLPDNAHASEWARDVASVTRVPRVALPREVGFVPVALFLLFGAGLLPSATAEVPEKTARIVDVPEQGAPADATDSELESGQRVEDAVRKLRQPEVPDRMATAQIERAIDAAFVRPEERQAARVELARAQAGDRAAAERLAKALLDGAGVLAESDPQPDSTHAPKAGSDAFGARSSPYADEAAFLRAYDVEVARLTRRDSDSEIGD